MIRERVLTQGIIRPLEYDEDLPAFKLCITPATVLERYMAAKQAADWKFASIEKARMRNIERASQRLRNSELRNKGIAIILSCEARFILLDNTYHALIPTMKVLPL